MLAYVFWHRAAQRAGRRDYEQALCAFHAALRDNAPPGFRGSAALRFEREPWLGWDRGAYEDWYLVDDWHALGILNQAAVSAALTGSHGGVARVNELGAGGLYEARGAARGAAAGIEEVRAANWFAKPREISPDEISGVLDGLASTGRLVLQRSLVLGPGPEFCVLGADEPELPTWLNTACSRRTRVWPDSGYADAGQGA